MDKNVYESIYKSAHVDIYMNSGNRSITLAPKVNIDRYIIIFIELFSMFLIVLGAVLYKSTSFGKYILYVAIVTLLLPWLVISIRYYYDRKRKKYYSTEGM